MKIILRKELTPKATLLGALMPCLLIKIKWSFKLYSRMLLLNKVLMFKVLIKSWKNKNNLLIDCSKLIMKFRKRRARPLLKTDN